MNFALSLDEVDNIEKATRGQHKNKEWFSYQIGRTTGCVVGKVMKSRTFTSNADVLKKICQPSQNLNTPALRYGQEHEKDGRAFYESAFQCHKNFKVNI
jgi:hypothetical protein